MLASRIKVGEKSERRIEPVFLICEAKQGGSKGGTPPWSQREGEAGSEATVGRGEAELPPSKGALWENGRGFDATSPSLFLTNSIGLV